MKIGFIDLGIMGRLMAKNLIKAGYESYVNDFHKKAVNDLAVQGVTTVTNAEEAALASKLVIVMLPSSPHVRTVTLNESGIVEGVHEDLVYVGMSSIVSLVSRKVHDEPAKVGILMLDTPVSGGEPRAADGTLAVMVGGDKAVSEQVAPVPDVMAGSVTYVDAIEADSIAKFANQTIVAANIATYAEAFVLAQKVDVDPKAVFQAIRGGLVGSTVMGARAPTTLTRSFASGLRINLHIKDFDNALDTGHDVNSPLLLTAAIRDMMSVLQGDGFDTDDHSGLLKYYEKLSDIELRPGESEE